jgi:hypothetical protein
MPQDTGTRSCVRRIRCLRCGCPSPDHPNANKYGGVSMASDTLCMACLDRLTRKGQHWIRTMLHATDSRQQTLTEATDGR